MATIARIKKDGTFLAKDFIHERTPVVSSGLVLYYPFDGTTDKSLDSIPSTTKVLGYYANVGAKPWYDWFASNTTLTNAPDITAVSTDTAKGYDLVIVDCYVWGVDPAIMSKLKDFVDAGVSCIAIGNDTRTNVFALAYDDTGHVTHNILIKNNLTGLSQTLYVGYGSNDLYGGITQLAPNCYPYYVRGDYETITGYFYVSPTSGAVMYFDQEGMMPITSEFVMEAVKLAFRKSLSLTVKSNIGYDQCGIVVQESGTNLVDSSTPFSTNLTPYTNGNDGVFMTEFGTEGLSVKNRQSWCGAYKSVSIPSPGTYTLSVWVKVISRTNTAINTTLYTAGLGQSDTFVAADWTKPNVWQKLTLTANYTSSGSAPMYLISFGGSDAPGYNVTCQYTMPQVEAGSFSKPYMRGSRGDGTLQIPIARHINNTSGTIFFRHYKNYGVSNTLISGSTTQNSPQNGLWWGMYFGGGGGVYQHWLDGSSTSELINAGQYTWADYAYTWDASYERIYVNGTQYAQKARSSQNPTDQFPTLSLGFGWNRGDGIFKDLAVYNTALTAQEIYSMTGESMKMTTSKVVSVSMKEGMYPVADGFHFPLSTDTLDFTRMVDASEKTNIVFDENGAWVGTATTNTIPNPTVNSLPTIGNGWGTYNTNQYGSGAYFSIGTVSSVTDNVVTMSANHSLRTYDVMRPQTTGGGLTAETDYFIKKVSATQFSVHQYNSSQDGTQGYINPATGDNKVHDSVALDSRISINSTNFPTMWWGAAHLPNSGLTKELIRGGFRGVSSQYDADCIRLHYKRDDNVVDGMASGADATVVVGSPATASFYTRSVTDTAVGKSMSFERYNYNASFTTPFSLGPINTWKRNIITFTPTTSTSCISYWFPEAGKYKYDIAAIQYEIKPFASPYTSSSRGASSLEYNLNSSIGLDWGGNWTICYWKKPMGTYTDNLTGYNIESLGCNSNSVGGAHIWWGKDNGGNSLAGTDAAYNFSPSDYFGEWQFISLVKIGTVITIKTWMKNGDVPVRTANVGGLSANAYVTQYGYDLKLGGWDNGNPTNTYFRDLVVVKRNLSDAELLNVYRQFSIYKTKAYAKNIIEEGI